MHLLIGIGLLLSGLSWLVVTTGSIQAQGGFTIYGRVSLPNGRPAPRVRVILTNVVGISREVQTDDQGQYEFAGLESGRYRLTANNPLDQTHFTDSTEVDTSRSPILRVIAHIYFREATTQKEKTTEPAVISVPEMKQQIPTKARKALTEGIKQREKGQFEKSLASFSNAIKLFPAYFQAWTERGESKIALRQCAAALTDFNQALTIFEDYVPALQGAGFCRLEQEEYSEAVTHLNRAVRLAPTNAKAHLYLGIAHLNLNEREVARQALLQALKLDQLASLSAYIHLADLDSREGRFTEAAAQLNQYLSLRPDAPNADRIRAMIDRLERQAAGIKPEK